MMSLSDRSCRPPPPIELLREASLFLDFDGTLVDIAPRPDAVRVSAELADVLSRLQQCLGGRVAIVGDPKDHSSTELIQKVVGPQ